MSLVTLRVNGASHEVDIEPSTPLLYVLQFDPQFVGVHAAGRRRERAGVVLGIVDQLVGAEDVIGHDRGVPIAGPPFVHDFRLTLWGEVVRLLADHRENVRLPVLKRRVLEQEEQFDEPVDGVKFPLLLKA